MTRKATSTSPAWIPLTKITMEGEERKVLIRTNAPIRIEEVTVRNQPLIHSVVRWLPHCRDERDEEKPLFACETVEEILQLLNG